METVTPPAPTDGAVIAKDAWAERTIHAITCPTGAVVRIRIPDLALLLSADALPEALRVVALEQLLKAPAPAPLVDASDFPPDAPTPESEARTPAADAAEKVSKFAALADLYHFLVSWMLVEPAYTPEELGHDSPLRPPAEDMEMLIDIARRDRNTDARGVTIGVEPLKRWATFRRHHECPESCQACAATLQDLSTARVLPV